MTWTEQAACAGKDPADWYERASIDARLTCAGCPVRIDCLAHAIATDEQEGIWGGLTPPRGSPMADRPVLALATMVLVLGTILAALAYTLILGVA